MEIPQKIRNKLPYGPAISLLGKYSEKITVQKYTRTPMFTAVLFTNARTWKQPSYLLTDEYKELVAYIYICTHTMEYYSAIKRGQL